jgi:hypothetical protein
LPSRRRKHSPARADYFDFARVTLTGAVKHPQLIHRRTPRDYSTSGERILRLELRRLPVF